MDGPYSRGASDEADCSSTNWDLHTGKETIYQTPIYELNTTYCYSLYRFHEQLLIPPPPSNEEFNMLRYHDELLNEK